MEMFDERRMALEAEMRCLTSSLSATDYKIIKCYEARLQDRDLPYDADSVIAERQAMRDRLNEIQEELER